MMSRPLRISRNLWQYFLPFTVSDTNLLDAYRDCVYNLWDATISDDVVHHNHHQWQLSAFEY